MKNGWRIIIIVVLIAILLGGICLGVGVITGADMSHIYETLDEQYNLVGWYDYFVKDLPAALRSAGFPI